MLERRNELDVDRVVLWRDAASSLAAPIDAARGSNAADRTAVAPHAPRRKTVRNSCKPARVAMPR
jgi:hypothetical protein